MRESPPAFPTDTTAVVGVPRMPHAARAVDDVENELEDELEDEVVGGDVAAVQLAPPGPTRDQMLGRSAIYHRRVVLRGDRGVQRRAHRAVRRLRVGAVGEEAAHLRRIARVRGVVQRRPPVFIPGIYRVRHRFAVLPGLAPVRGIELEELSDALREPVPGGEVKR